MRFQVPQFINIEDKLLGPFSIKQFVYLVGGGSMIYIVFSYLPWYLSIFIIVPVAAFTIALAFLKPNGKPFIFLVQAAVQYFLSSRLYLWRRVPKKMTPDETIQEFSKKGNDVPSLSDSKLKDLTWALDINQNVKRRK